MERRRPLTGRGRVSHGALSNGRTNFFVDKRSPQGRESARSYRHHFHAGNHADVLKHALLVRLLLALEKKEKPFRFLDTHAGAGLYDLHDERASKNREFESGIARLWEGTMPPRVSGPTSTPCGARTRTARSGITRCSPRIARGLLRASDRMVVTDLNAAEAEEGHVRARPAGRRRAQGRLRGAPGLLPPPQRRGLVLVDSGFDQAEEFSRLVARLAEGYRRFGTGLAPDPLMDPGSMPASRPRSSRRGSAGSCSSTRSGPRVRGSCGSQPPCLKPPWHFDDEARPILEWLTPVLAQDEGAASSVRWLVPE